MADSTNAIDCLEIVVSEVICYVLSVMLTFAYSVIENCREECIGIKVCRMAN